MILEEIFSSLFMVYEKKLYSQFTKRVGNMYIPFLFGFVESVLGVLNLDDFLFGILLMAIYHLFSLSLCTEVEGLGNRNWILLKCRWNISDKICALKHLMRLRSTYVMQNKQKIWYLFTNSLQGTGVLKYSNVRTVITLLKMKRNTLPYFYRLDILKYQVS